MQVEKITEYIVNWLKDYVTKANLNGFVIGISGGVDSAVCSALCARTGFKTLLLEMPIHQAQSQVDRAYEHIFLLEKTYSNVSHLTTELTPVFDLFKTQFPSTHSKNQPLALANTRARLRMTTLYYFACLNNLLVAGTGNKVEDFGVGFFTKYGDGGVDISPIADLLKSEVYELAAYLNIPQSILDAPPTDGLFGDNRTDADQLGATYDELEWAMKMHDNHFKETDFDGRQKEVFLIYRKLNKINQHKMNPIPVCKIPLKLK